MGVQTLLHGLAYAPGLASLALERLHVDRGALQRQPLLDMAPELHPESTTPQALHALERAPGLATELRSHYVGTEHLLAALIRIALVEPGGEGAPFGNAALFLLAPFGVDRAAIEGELENLTACSLAWRMEFSPERGGEVFWRRLDRELFTWREGTCVKLASGIREDQALGRLPILGDALEEAGCTDLGVLRHCREHGPGHKGWCWLVETLLVSGDSQGER